MMYKYMAIYPNYSINASSNFQHKVNHMYLNNFFSQFYKNYCL